MQKTAGLEANSAGLGALACRKAPEGEVPKSTFLFNLPHPPQREIERVF